MRVICPIFTPDSLTSAQAIDRWIENPLDFWLASALQIWYILRAFLGVVSTGRSAVRSAHLLWEQRVGGSNPLAPILILNTVAPVAQLDRATDF